MANDNGTTLAPAAQRRDFIDKIREGAERHLVAMAGTERGKALAAGVVMAFDTANRRDPKVGQCAPDSVSVALATTISTDLKPGGPMPDCYLIPRQMSYKDAQGNWQKRWELQWMISWRGMVTLARRAGYGLKVVSVHQGDSLAHPDGVLDLLDPRTPRLIMGDGDRSYDTLQGVIVVAYRIDDQRTLGWEWVPMSTIESRRAVSDAYRRGAGSSNDRDRASPWFQWPVEMAMKTAVRYAISRALVPVEADLGAAIARDDADDRIIDAEFAEGAGAKSAIRKAIAEKLPPVILDEPTREPARQDQGPTPEEAAELLRLEREQADREAAERRAAEQGDDEGMA